MDFFDAVQTRRSTRIYEPRLVENDKLRQILDTINAAPSAGNLQAYDVVVVKDDQLKDALAAAAWDQICIARAPVVLVFCSVPKRSAERFQRRSADLFCIQDAAIAASYGQLAATALGLSSVWVGSFDAQEAKKVIDAPAYADPVSIMPIGYPAETPLPSPRRPLDDLVYEEKIHTQRQNIA